MNCEFWIITVVIFVGLFLASVIFTVLAMLEKITREYFLIGFSSSIMGMTIIVTLFSFFGGNVIDNTVVWGRIIWFESVLCFTSSSWLSIACIIIIIENFFQNSIDKQFLQELFSEKIFDWFLITVFITTITSVLLFVKSLNSANVYEMLFSMFKHPVETENIIIGTLGWIVISIATVWLLAVLVSGIQNIYEEIRDNEISKEFSGINSREKLIERLYDYSRKHRISNAIFRKILLKAGWIFSSHTVEMIIEKYKKYNIQKIIKKLDKEDITYLLFSGDFKETNFENSSEDFFKQYMNEKTVSFDDQIYLKNLELNQLRKTILTLEDELHEKRNKLHYLTDKINVIESEESYNYGVVQEGITAITKNKESNTASIVRDIYHLTKTPLRTISQASKNIEMFKDDLNLQEESIRIIDTQVSLVEIILDSYRQLAMEWPDKGCLDDITSFIIAAAKSTAMNEKKTVPITFDGTFPNELCYQGNGYAAIILKPLIDNAVEASPDKECVIVRCEDKEDECVITIENKCIRAPRQRELDKPGFTTKESGGIGLKSVRSLTKKSNFKFNIVVLRETNTVRATISFPKSTASGTH